MLGEAHTPMVNSALTASWKKVELSSSLLQQPLRLLQAEEECQSLSPTSCLRNAMSSHLANVTWHHKLQSGNRWFNPLRYISWRKSTPLHNQHSLTLLPQLACTIDHYVYTVLFEAVNIQINLNCSIALETQGSVVRGETHWHEQDCSADHQQGYSECEQSSWLSIHFSSVLARCRKVSA